MLGFVGRRVVQEMVLEESLARLRKGWSPGIGRLDWNELYDDAR